MSGDACYQGLECTSSNLECPQCARPSDTQMCSGGMAPALGELMVSGGRGLSPPGHSVIAVSGWHEKKHRRGTPELSGTKIPMGWSYSKSFTVSCGPNRQKAFWCSGPQPLRGVSVRAGDYWSLGCRSTDRGFSVVPGRGMAAPTIYSPLSAANHQRLVLQG